MKQAATEEKKMLDRVDKELRTTKEAGYLVKVHNDLFMSRETTSELDQQALDDMIELSFSEESCKKLTNSHFCNLNFIYHSRCTEVMHYVNSQRNLRNSF
jgi:hypothetical protein